MSLQVLAPGESRWNLVNVPDLPPVAERQHFYDQPLSPTLAKRRVSQKSKRAASASPEQQTLPKALRPTVIQNVMNESASSNAVTNTGLATDTGDVQSNFIRYI